MNPVFSATVGSLLLLVVLGTPGASAARVQEADGEIEITVEVLPSETPGTVSAVLLDAAPETTGGPEAPATFDLIVADDRGSADGWQVHIMQSPVEAPGDELMLPRQLHRTDVLVGQPTQPRIGPRWNRLAAGQSLDQQTPVLVAAPGAGAGVYRHTLEVESPESGESERHQLVITISSAP